MALPSVAVSELVTGALRGERAAERQLYERHAPPLRRFAEALVRDGHDAADIVQETFARAFRLLPTLAEPAEFVPWLHGIARNVSRECLKRRRRSLPRPETLVLLAGRSPATPEHELFGSEAARLVERTLARMPAARAEALLLRVERSLPYADIARALGWTVSKAKVEVHRARSAIAAALEAPLPLRSPRTARWLPGAMALSVVLVFAGLLAGSKPAQRSSEPRAVQPVEDAALASMLPDASTFAICAPPDDQCRVPPSAAVEAAAESPWCTPCPAESRQSVTFSGPEP